MSVENKFGSRKLLLVAFCLAYIFIYLLTNNNDAQKEQSNASLRGKTVGEEPIAAPVDVKEVHMVADTAINDMSATARDEFQRSKTWLHDAIIQARKSIHRTMDSYLKVQGELSDETVEKIDKEVSRKVEAELQADLIRLVNRAVEEAKEDLGEFIGEDIEEGGDTKSVENDIDAVREYYVEILRNGINDLELQLEDKIRGVTQRIEKDMIKEKTNRTVTSETLEEEEITSVILEKEDEVFDMANEDALALKEEVEEVEKTLDENIKNMLRKFLVDEKKLTPKQSKEIEELVLDSLHKQEVSLIDEEIEGLEQIANDNLDNIEATAEQNVSVLKGAKEMGMESKIDTDVDIVENSLNSLSSELEVTFRQITTESKNNIIDSLRESIKSIEKTVLEEKGVKISEEELSKLIENETGKVLLSLKAKEREINA